MDRMIYQSLQWIAEKKKQHFKHFSAKRLQIGSDGATDLPSPILEWSWAPDEENIIGMLPHGKEMAKKVSLRLFY